MKITKIYSVESSHRVPGATTTRCRGLHGHSYKIEISLSGSPLNNACMVLDFSVLKDAIKPFIDSFDHCELLCDTDDEEYVKFMKNHCQRWISAPFNWSCEMMSLMIFRFCQHIIQHTEFTNGENPEVTEVTVWETATGRCTATADDVTRYFTDMWMIGIGFSDDVVKDWPQCLKDMVFNPDGAKTYKTKHIKEHLKFPGINC